MKIKRKAFIVTLAVSALLASCGNGTSSSTSDPSSDLPSASSSAKTSTVQYEFKAEVYDSYLDFNKSVDYQMVLEPSSVFKITSQDHLNAYQQSKITPEIVSIELDEEMNVLHLDEKMKLKDFFVSYIQDRSLLLVSLNSKQVADAYLKYIYSDFFIKDAFIQSNDLEILSMFYNDKNTSINNLVFDASEYNLEDKTTRKNILYEMTKVNAGIVLLDYKDNNLYDNLEYFNKRFKITWVKSDDSIEITNRIVASRSYGIVHSNIELVDSVLKQYTKPGRNHVQYVAAHRGVTESDEKSAVGYNENSLSSVVRASELNADYVEIDLQVTKDDVIVLCHNEVLSPTSTCETASKKITNITYSALSNYYLNDKDPDKKETFPKLSEIFEATKDTSLMYVLEFKFDGNMGKASRRKVSSLIDKLVNEYDVKDRVVGITFFNNQYDDINKYMPYLPKASLGYEPSHELGVLSEYLKENRTGLDLCYSDTWNTQAKNWMIRGYPYCTWTSNVKNVKSWLAKPITLNTSDGYVSIKNQIKDYQDKEYFYFASTNDVPKSLQVNWRDYEGNIVKKEAELLKIGEAKNGLTNAVFYLQEEDFGLYSKPIVIGIGSEGASETYQKPSYDVKTKTLVI